MRMLQTVWTQQLQNNGPNQAHFDAKLESGTKVQVGQYMLDILNNLTKMHKVLTSTMETGQLEVIFKEAFRLLVEEIEKFFVGINTDSKFAKTRVRVDLQQISNVISKIQFENRGVSEMAEQKIKSLMNTKCPQSKAQQAESESQPA